MEAREGGGPRGASPHRARGAGEGIADALSREMRRAAAEDLEADYFFDCRNAVDEEIELRAQAATAQEVKEEGAAMGAAETELFVEELIVGELAGRHGDAIVDAFAKEGARARARVRVRRCSVHCFELVGCA